MDFFDKLGKKAQEAYQTTKDKTKEISGENLKLIKMKIECMNYLHILVR